MKSKTKVTSPESQVQSPAPSVAQSIREFRTQWRAGKEEAIALGDISVTVLWHPLTDGEREPIICRTRMALPPLKAVEGGGPPKYDRQDPEYLARRQRVETEARALAVFYGVPALRKEFAELHNKGGLPLPTPSHLLDADIRLITEFLCGSETGLPPELMLAIERRVLGDFNVADEVEAAAAVF